jgi:hypothetical protein
MAMACRGELLEDSAYWEICLRAFVETASTPASGSWSSSCLVILVVRRLRDQSLMRSGGSRRACCEDVGRGVTRAEGM